MTPTPEQLEKMAHDFVRSNECEVMDDYSAHEATYKAGAHAMQSLMDAQAAKAQCLVEALDQIDEQAFNNGYHGITAITLEALAKWRTK